MRILMGEQQQQQQIEQIGQQQQRVGNQTEQPTQQPQRLLEASVTVDTPIQSVPATPRRLYDDADSDDDSNSDLGLDVDENDLAGGLDVQQATAMARYLGLGLGLGGGGVGVRAARTDTPANSSDAVPNETVVVQERDTNETNAADVAAATPDDDDDRQEEYAAEEVVLMDAFWSALDGSFWSPMYQYVTDTTAQLIQPATRPLLTGSLGITLLSGGIGIWGYWNGVYNRPSISNYRMELPSSRTMWSTTLLGGASAGLILLGRSYLRCSVATTSKSTTESSPDDDKKKQT
jgi:hypothetical protein